MTVTLAAQASQNLPGAKELEIQSAAVGGGTLYIATVRKGGVGPVGVGMCYVPTSATLARRFALTSARNTDGSVVVHASPASGAFLVTFTPGTAESLDGHSTQNTNLTDTAYWELDLPDTYVAATDINVTVNANYTGSGTAGTCNVLATAYKLASDGTSGANLVATAAAAITGTAGDKTFVITGATLSPGDRVIIGARTLITETGNTNPLTGHINSVRIAA